MTNELDVLQADIAKWRDLATLREQELATTTHQLAARAAELAATSAQLTTTSAQLTTAKEQLGTVSKELTRAQRDYEHLLARFRARMKKIFGASSERLHPDQLQIEFGELEALATELAPDPVQPLSSEAPDAEDATRPAKKLAAKWRAKDSGAEHTTLLLARNPDVLATLTRGRRSASKTVIAFALETGSGLARARKKLAKKGADWIVLNDPSALGGERTSVTLLGADGEHIELRDRTKHAVARSLVELLGPV